MYKRDSEGPAKRENDFKKKCIDSNSLKRGYEARKIVFCDARDIKRFSAVSQ